MAIINKNELKNMNVKALQTKLDDLKKELVRLNAQIKMGTTPENPGKIKIIKKTIARIITLLKTKPKEEIKKA